jgi:hypothetical protein
MQSEAKTVAEYLLEVPEERKAVLKKIRAVMPQIPHRF